MTLPYLFNEIPDPLPYPPEMDEADLVEYKRVDETRLNAWVYAPVPQEPAKPRPAIVFFFGGGWLRGSPMQFRHNCAFLAARGILSIAVDYRVGDRHGAMISQCVSDAKSTMRWVRSNADDLGINAERIVAAGSSAGGLLAAATATLPGHDDPRDDQTISPIPNAQILFNPVVLMEELPGKLSIPQSLSELTDGRMGAPARSLSPYHHVQQGMGPALIFHGMSDQIVPYESVLLFQEKMAQYGNRCDVYGYRDAVHGFANYGRGNNAAFVDTLNKMDEFQVSIGYLKGAPCEAAIENTE